MKKLDKALADMLNEIRTETAIREMRVREIETIELQR